MPALVIVTATPGEQATGAHRRVTLSSSAGTTTLTITDPEVAHSNLERNYVEVARPGQDKPFLRDAGGKLHKWKLSAILYAQPPADVAADLQTLMFGHTRAASVAVAYGRLESAVAVISDLTVKTTQRVEGSNEPYWADIDIELTEKPDDVRQLVPVPTPAATPAPAPNPPPPTSATYTVRSGDTLWAIAQKHYGHGDYWPRIATANNIRDPRRIYPGQVLTIPA